VARGGAPRATAEYIAGRSIQRGAIAHHIQPRLYIACLTATVLSIIYAGSSGEEKTRQGENIVAEYIVSGAGRRGKRRYGKKIETRRETRKEEKKV
jgi:hypothetical protein